MSIAYTHELRIDAPLDTVFAMIDDLPATARWLPPCVSLTKVSEGPNQVGDVLRYVYREGKREAEMQGEILARVPGERLHCRYWDPMFEVSVDLRVEPLGEATLSRHLMEITPKTFFGRLLTPLIRMGLRKQTQTAASNLKALLESSAA